MTGGAVEPAVRYRKLPPEQPAREMEDALLALWKEEDLFRRSLDARGRRLALVAVQRASPRLRISALYARFIDGHFFR